MRLRTAIALATLVPLLSVGVVFVPNAAEQRWQQMVAWASKAEHAWNAREFAREPAWGDATAGSAFAAYDDAMRLTTQLGGRDRELLRDLRLAPDKVTTKVAEDFALRWRAPLAALSAGAHCTEVRPPIDWSKGFAQQPRQLLVGRDLQNSAVIEVRRRIRAGDGIGGVALLLEAATCAVDLQRSPLIIDQMIASALLQIAVGEALRDEELRRLDPASLQLLADGLVRVDANCATVFDGHGEALLLARTLVEAHDPRDRVASAIEDDALEARSWRYGWSKRWAAADAVMTLVEACDELDAARDMPWPQRRERIDAVYAGLQQHGNALLAACATNGVSVEGTLRLVLTHVRLLRLAVAFHRGEALPGLDDPLGQGPLGVERRGSTAVFRSAGAAGDRPIERVTALR